MVKPEDMPRFVGHIRAEAQRLVTLIGDIIRLSELDEGGEHADGNGRSSRRSRRRPQKISSAAAEAKQRDHHRRRASTPRSSACGGSCMRSIYNLCDNAIKYNAAGGSVNVQRRCRGRQRLSSRCRDTGIGIPPEHQSRIFERFYRVDKSHSKASGGTGLGLSIVKHAVAYHHGTIALKSEVGKGTEITVRFPQEK